MNEEEKDSVKILNDTELDVNTIYSVDLYTYNYAVKTVLNLIEKQQSEIEKLRKQKIEYQPSITITNSELLKGE